MKRAIFIASFLLFSSLSISQNSPLIIDDNDSIVKKRRWSLKLGGHTTLIQGDLSNYATESGIINMEFGYSFAVNYTMNPVFNLELELFHNELFGQPQKWSYGYQVKYTSNTLENVYFDGKSNGVKLLLGINVSSFGTQNNRKFNFLIYSGLGYHSYNSKLYDLSSGRLLLTPDSIETDSDGVNESWILPFEFSFNYKLNNRLDIELRSSFNINYEDHLDSALSDKQNYETFLNIGFGLRYHLGNPNKKTLAWGLNNKRIDLTDKDNDGVLDRLDKDVNTPKGVKVYGDGTAVDSDGDSVPDYLDECPFEKGNVQNKGCPDTNKVKVKEKLIDE